MHLGLNWAYIRKPYEKSSIYGHLEFFFFFGITIVFLTKLKFFVRKKIGDMHVMRGGGGGVSYTDHFTVQRVSYWCFACCRKLFLYVGRIEE